MTRPPAGNTEEIFSFAIAGSEGEGIGIRDPEGLKNILLATVKETAR